MKQQVELYRELPSVDELLHDSRIAALIPGATQAAVTDACRAVLNRLRGEVTAGTLDEGKLAVALSEIQQAVEHELSSSLRYSLRPVINATGVILHTNLGRAPVSEAALEHIREVAGTYSNLEFDLDSGERGKRDVHVDRLFQKLLTEDLGRSPNIRTIIVNNNAAAVLLALNTLAEGGEVIVSRGELVEIGGSFRVPDVMSKSGAVLREVGTTNRTRISDYERAINEHTKLLLRVHRSNFEITGFTEQPSVAELIALAEKRKLPLMEDLGSGALFNLANAGIPNEPTILDSLRAGVHVVTYSGDKLLGGPQSGIISGREELVKRMRGNSLFRALRVDKLTYAALEATLLSYVKKDHDAVPALRMMRLRKDELRHRAEELLAKAGVTVGPRIELVRGESLIGGGSAPSATLETTLIGITSEKLTANDVAARFRAADPCVIARVEGGRVVLDLRTVFPAQDEPLARVLKQVLA